MKWKNLWMLLFLTMNLYGQTFDTLMVKKEIDSLISEGSSLAFNGNSIEAFPLIEQAQKKCKQSFGKNSIIYTRYLLAHGYLFSLYGDYKKGISKFHEGKSILENINQDDIMLHPMFLTNIGINYQLLGEYDRAEEFLLRGTSRIDTILGKEHINYAQCLVNLASFYKLLGNYQKAETLLIEATNIIENKGSEKNSLVYTIALRELANLWSTWGKWEKAEQYFLKANQYLGDAFGEENQEYGIGLNELGLLYLKMDKIAEAEEYLLKGNSVLKNFFGEEHPDYARSLFFLSNLYLSTKNYNKAEEHIETGKNIIEKVLGKRHYQYAAAIKYLATLNEARQEFSSIPNLLIELFLNLQFQTKTAFAFLSKSQKEEYIKTNIQPDIFLIQSKGLNFKTLDFQNVQYDIALLMKGIQLQADIKTFQFILGQKDTSTLNLYQDLLIVYRQLNTEYQQPITQRTNIAQLESQQEQLEKQLARLSNTFRKEQAASKITHQEVKAALREGEAALEFVHFDFYNPEKTDSIMYAAILLRPDQEQAHYIPLFEEKQLDYVLRNDKDSTNTLPNQLYALRGLKPGKKKILSEQLYQLVWQPLDTLLSGVHTIYYSPSGLLHRLNISAMPLGNKQRLGDKYQLFQLSSTRQIALKADTTSTTFNTPKAIIAGGIYYGKQTLENLPTLLPDSILSNEIITENLFQKFQRSMGHRGENWQYLPNTAEEASTIHQTLQSVGYDSHLLTQTGATEEIIKSIGTTSESPQVLHLATHGFFFPNPEDTLHQSGNEPIFKIITQPMLRSGLVLSGANEVWNGNPPPLGQEDGILTAYEIAQMNLSNTELVVLSACETGLGDIKGNEGVFGLQRAFKMAGVKYLIMSLWKVPDEATKDLMVAFYDNWLKQEMDIPTAFQRAQQEMRKLHKDPRKWAGFVLVE